MNSKFARLTTMLVLVLTMAAVLPALSTSAATASVSAPKVVSIGDPLPPWTATQNGCGSYSDYKAWKPYSDWEEESTIAVNPTNPKNLVTAWMQDYGDAIATAYSNDGGGHWTTVVPPTVPCTGGVPGYTNGALDESLSIGPSYGPGSTQGVVYLSSIIGTGPPSYETALIVNRSFDGGKTWTTPVIVDQSADNPTTGDLDTTYVIADQKNAGVAYAVTLRIGPTANTSWYQYVFRTTDGGATWSQPSPDRPSFIPSSDLQGAAHLLILPNGTLLDVFAQVPRGQIPSYIPGITVVHGPTTLWVSTSTDNGGNWSPAAPLGAWTADDTLYLSISAALAPDGKTIYVTWQRSDQRVDPISGSVIQVNRVMFTKSSDGGKTWQWPRKVKRLKGALEFGVHGLPAAPAIAVAPNGTVGIAFYDHRRDAPGTNPSRATDLWLEYSQDGGAHWSESHLAGPFDQTTAPNYDPGGCGAQPSDLPNQGGGFLGDYQGIAPISGGFVNSFVMAKPLGSTPDAGTCYFTNPTDVYFDKVMLPWQSVSPSISPSR